MKKYKIRLIGKGSESFIFPINEEQKLKLKEMDIEKSNMDFEDIGKVLGVEFVSDTEFSFTGPYADPELYGIQVEDGNGELVWESDETFYPEGVDEKSIYDDEDVLLIEDYQKGSFYVFDVELEEEFNPEKISTKVTEIAERVEIITGLTYDGKDLEDYKDFEDTWSKGLYYYLCEKYRG